MGGWGGVGEIVTFKLGPAGQKGVSLSRTLERELQVEVPEMGRNLACWRNGGQASVAQVTPVWLEADKAARVRSHWTVVVNILLISF